MEWIKVSERLPDEGNEVLLYVYDEIVQGYLWKGIWKGSEIVTRNMNDGYVNDRNIGKQGSHFDTVSHWMPLPEPPKPNKMKLTKKKIAELEARGIKPGIKLRCALYNHDIFRFNSWDQIERDLSENIIFAEATCIIYSGPYKKYATPIT